MTKKKSETKPEISSDIIDVTPEVAEEVSVAEETNQIPEQATELMHKIMTAAEGLDTDMVIESLFTITKFIYCHEKKIRMEAGKDLADLYAHLEARSAETMETLRSHNEPN